MLNDLIITTTNGRHARIVSESVGSVLRELSPAKYEIYAELIGEDTLGLIMQLGSVVSVRPGTSWNSNK